MQLNGGGGLADEAKTEGLRQRGKLSLEAGMGKSWTRYEHSIETYWEAESQTLCLR